MKIRCPRFIKWLFRPVTRAYDFVKGKITKSIRLELLVLFAVCLIAAFTVGAFVKSQTRHAGSNARIDYSYGIRDMNFAAKNIADDISRQNISIADTDGIKDILSMQNFKAAIVDTNGKIICQAQDGGYTDSDIYSLVNKYVQSRNDWDSNYKYITKGSNEYTSLYTVSFSDGKGYVIISGVPYGQIVYDNYSGGMGNITTLITFLLLFYFITNRKMKYIEAVSGGLLEISKGNLKHRISLQGEDEIAALAENINSMAEKLETQIESERQAERTKSELITNVSHDLRTPLTSIKGYLGLIKEGKVSDEEQLGEFVNIAYNKSLKLEMLINDLFEYTKLSNKGVSMNYESVSLKDMLEQLEDELVPICEENNMKIDNQLTEDKINVKVDPNKTVRIFENLLMNAIRYSKKPGTIMVSLEKDGEFAKTVVKNPCDKISKDEINKLFDRFYRLDKSRSSETGGSGLGLAIAKNIAELQGGSLEASYDESTESISFTVKLKIDG